MSPYVFKNYVIDNILNKEWFKKAFREKKVTITYLCKNTFESKKIYLKEIDKKLSFNKFMVMKFQFEPLENDNHLKLLNINLKNEALYNMSTLIFHLQEKFLNSIHFLDLIYFSRKLLVEKYWNKYNSYMDLSILSKILNNTHFNIKNKIFKLSDLIPTKTFLKSLYIRDIINNYPNINSDKMISLKLKDNFNIDISRRNVNHIRNKFLIFYKRRKSFSRNNFSQYYLLSKKNIQLIEYKQKGIYEFISERMYDYPYIKSKIVYIGSSNNLRKRLFNYTNNTLHNKDLKIFFENENTLYFRFIKTSFYKKYEKFLINSFIEDSGSLPLLNKQKILH